MRKTLSCLLLLLLFSVVYGAVPGQVSFQGILKDSSGSPVTGQRDITFYIYPTAAGGGPLWNETQTVSVEAGLYNVRLGSVTPLTTTVFDGNTKYLAISIGGLELLPRVVLLTVPYAYKAEKADTATYADLAGASGSAAGTVIFDSPTQQTTSAATAVWVKNTKNGGGSLAYAAISAEASGIMGVGIVGVASDASGLRNVGGGFYANSLQGMAVYGEARATTLANNYGGYFLAKGDGGRGVFGKADSLTGITYGGYFKSDSSSGTGVYGESLSQGVRGLSLGALGIGVSGQALQSSGRGVQGLASHTGSQNYGGYFTAAGNQGGTSGVYGAASNGTTTGSTFGGYFTTQGDQGASAGVYGLAENGVASGTYGGWFYTLGSDGSAGVYGEAGNGGASASYGGQFYTAGQENSAAVYGFANNGIPVVTYGGQFTTASSGGSGVYGQATQPTAYAAEFVGGQGIVLPSYPNPGPMPVPSKPGTIVYSPFDGHFYGYSALLGWKQLDN